MAASTWRTATSTAGTPTSASLHGKTVTSKAIGALDHALEETTPPAIASKALGRLANILGHDTTQTAITWKALGRLAYRPGHETTRTATTWKALGRLADHAVRDILARLLAASPLARSAASRWSAARRSLG